MKKSRFILIIRVIIPALMEKGIDIYVLYDILIISDTKA